MALTKVEIESLEFTFARAPFCNLVAHPSIVVDTLEYTFNGAPWWGHFGTPLTPPQPPSGFNIWLGATQVQKMYLGNVEITKAYLGSIQL